MLLEVDPIALVRGRKGGGTVGFALGQYVDDRPYTASSMLAIALSHVLKTAMLALEFEPVDPWLQHRPESVRVLPARTRTSSRR